jgi:hypothetical protein
MNDQCQSKETAKEDQGFGHPKYQEGSNNQSQQDNDFENLVPARLQFMIPYKFCIVFYPLKKLAHVNFLSFKKPD